jgi:hypothetical protein
MARTAPWYSRVPVWGVALLLGLFLLATNSYPSPQHNGELITYAAKDGWSYRAIADAFPHFIAANGLDLPHHHAQRFIAPWLVGGFSSLTGLTLEASFRIVAIALLVAITALLLATLRALNRSRADQLLLLALFVLQPVVTRFYVAFPFVIPDVVFVLGLTMVVRGMTLNRLGWIVAGVLVAALARQTALLLLPGLLVWALMAKPQAGPSRAMRLGVVAAGALVAVVLYLLTGHYSEPFSLPNVNGDMVTGLFSWLAHQFSLRALTEFLARGLVPLLIPLGLLIAVFLRRARPIDWPVVAPLLVLAATVAAQPLLGGPAITGNNIARLALLAYPALILALAVMLTSVDLRRSPTGLEVAITTLALAIGSMHHITSLIGEQDSTGATTFGIVETVVAVVVLVITWRWRFTARRPVAEPAAIAPRG